ncbi:uncharacterized protein LOC131943872 [Physella acuta]|uniref:uncharacterized protein LOC131943872 n=1 Tax=Physella acuta TaxID=109671 RepID=UPI0027DD4D72|nr:uncharacterized protein LOC131943872 [Physella acuta]
MMNDFNEKGLYQLYTTTTGHYYRDKDRDSSHIELDDTAPLPLLIGIGLALFLGFVVLVLICCLCRRRRPASSSEHQHPNMANYQRAPVTDGMVGGGGGMAYPMTAVPPSAFHNSIPYNPHMGHTVHNYGVIGSGMKFNHPPQGQYPQQPPHFGGVPTFPPNQYIPSLPLPPMSTPHQSHSLSHSSQASSSVSGATADPLVPMSTSPNMHAQQPQQQQYHPHQYQQMPSVLQHHQHLQQMAGRESPSFQYPPMSYSTMMSNEMAANPATLPTSNTLATTVMTSSVTSPPLNRPTPNHQPYSSTPHSSSCTDEE